MALEINSEWNKVSKPDNNSAKIEKTHYVGPKDKRLGGKHVYTNKDLLLHDQLQFPKTIFPEFRTVLHKFQ